MHPYSVAFCPVAFCPGFVCREIEKERDCERREKEKDQYRWVRVRIRVRVLSSGILFGFSFSGILSEGGYS